ncbi:uncharacterized protein IUM83_06442 [Phytophthora cinnamomi]|nr:hypothetical protein IUM83_06442 [Phytophthora cinnamomi]
MWSCQVVKKDVLECVNRRYSPMEFHFQAKSKVCQENFRLLESKAQILISVCAGAGSATSVPHATLRMLLQHEFFQPLSKFESHHAERELLERV